MLTTLFSPFVLHGEGQAALHHVGKQWLQTLAERCPRAVGGLAPTHFGQGDSAGVGLIEQALGRGDTFAPQRAGHSVEMALFKFLFSAP